MARRDHGTAIASRVEAFISTDEAKTLTGDRRMGSARLLDMVADAISQKDPSANIIKIDDSTLDRSSTEDTISFITDNMKERSSNCIMIYDGCETVDINMIRMKFGDTPVFRVKELCHQVPVCFKEA